MQVETKLSSDNIKYYGIHMSQNLLDTNQNWFYVHVPLSPQIWRPMNSQDQEMDM